MSTKESYGGCGNVSNLGNYTDSIDANLTQQYKNREELLNTLVKGTPNPNNIKKCSELISSDKKKGIIKKSEN